MLFNMRLHWHWNCLLELDGSCPETQRISAKSALFRCEVGLWLAGQMDQNSPQGLQIGRANDGVQQAGRIPCDLVEVEERKIIGPLARETLSKPFRPVIGQLARKRTDKTDT